MKRIIHSCAVIILSSTFFNAANAQWLTENEKNVLLESWASVPELYGFSHETKQKALDNPANTRYLRSCALAFQQNRVLKDSRAIMFRGNGHDDADLAYDKINSNFAPEYVKKIFPRFNKNEFIDSRSQYSKIKGATGGVELSYTHLTTSLGPLRVQFIKNRNDNFSKEAAFTTLEFAYPEEIKGLIKRLGQINQVKAETGLSTNELITELLEFTYWIDVVIKAEDQIMSDMQKLKRSLDDCNHAAADVFREIQKDDPNNNASWAGKWRITGSESTIHTIENDGSGWVIDDNTNTTSQWSGCKQQGSANTIECKWTSRSDDQDKSLTFGGTITLTMKGNSMDVLWVEKGLPNVTWKPGHNSYDLKLHDGREWKYSLTRK